MKGKILLGLSGGVDSAIAAHLLLEEGYEVTGCYMRNWDSALNNDYLGNPTASFSQCPQEKDYQDAKKVAEKLGIPLLRIDYIKEYWDNVFSYFLAEYKEGRTPNPDVLCNREIKFGPFLSYAKEHGFDFIAMGHYARKVELCGHHFLAKPRDLMKDQTYFLCALTEEQIAPSLFPMSEITKVEARLLAERLGLSEVSSKHGSTGVCFIGERRFHEFLSNYFPAQKGEIKDLKTGETIGMHDGVLFYTVGQRRGLGIGGVKGKADGAWIVAKKDPRKNILYVVNSTDDSPLLSDRATLAPSSFNFLGEEGGADLSVQVKFRYRQPDNPAVLHLPDPNHPYLTYDPPVKAVTPGQWAAIYSDTGILLGGGIVSATYFRDERTDI